MRFSRILVSLAAGFLGLCVSDPSAFADTPRSPDVHQRADSGTALGRVSRILKRKGVTSIPSTSKIVNNSTSSSKLLPEQGIEARAVSGIPPLLVNIPSLTVKELFWQPGVVDAIASGTATADQCRQFYFSDTDGQSAGVGACQQVEGVGHSFESLLNAETSLCFMRNLPTKQNLAAGAITKVKGKFPNNDITKLFAPGDRARVVQVNARPVRATGPEEKIFVKIPSIAQNARAKRSYAAELYFCPEGQPSPRGYNLVTVSQAGVLTLNIANASDPFGGGANSLVARGSLKAENGALTWDPTKERSSTLNVTRNTNNFKSSFTISAESVLYQKVRNAFGPRISKDYNVSRFTGSDITALAVTEGAFAGRDEFGTRVNEYTGTTEFRDPRYLAAPSSSFLEQVQLVDIATDSFYESPAVTDVDTSKYSCTPKVDIEISMTSGNSQLESSLGSCVRREFDRIEFCRNDEAIQQAVQNFPSSCALESRPPGGGGPGSGPPGGGGPMP